MFPDSVYIVNSCIKLEGIFLNILVYMTLEKHLKRKF